MASLLYLEIIVLAIIGVIGLLSAIEGYVKRVASLSREMLKNEEHAPEYS